MSDFTDIKKVEARLRDATNKLHRLAPQVAIARQVKEFSSDRRKALLAKWMKNAMAGDTKMSATVAETHARANPAYLDELKTLEIEYRDAEQVIATWSATQATWDAARSLLSMTRETFHKFQG